MPSRLNQLLEQQLRSDFEEIDNLLVVDYQGLNSEKMAEFRDALRSSNLRMEVVKNSIFRIAVRDLPAQRLLEDEGDGAKTIAGPVGIITGGESAIDCARFAVEWLKKNRDTIQLKAALMGTEVFRAGQVVELSKMPSRQELLGMMANAVQSPLQKLAATMQAGYARILWGMNALAEKLDSKD